MNLTILEHQKSKELVLKALNGLKIKADGVSSFDNRLYSVIEVSLTNRYQLTKFKNSVEAFCRLLNKENISIKLNKNRAQIEIPKPKPLNYKLSDLPKNNHQTASKSKDSFILGVDIHQNPVVFELNDRNNLFIEANDIEEIKKVTNVIDAQLAEKELISVLKLSFLNSGNKRYTSLEVNNSEKGIKSNIRISTMTREKNTASVFHSLNGEFDYRFEKLMQSKSRNLTIHNQRSTEQFPRLIVFVNDCREIMHHYGNAFLIGLSRLSILGPMVGISLIVATSREFLRMENFSLKLDFNHKLVMGNQHLKNHNDIFKKRKSMNLIGFGDSLLIHNSNKQKTYPEVQRIHLPLL